MTSLGRASGVRRNPFAQRMAQADGIGLWVIDGEGRELASELREGAKYILQLVRKSGGVLFRGYSDFGEAALSSAALSLSSKLCRYEFGSTPRTALTKHVYTSTEYPAHQEIPLHNEQSYTSQWPNLIWFHALLVARLGGETPIADSRRIHQRLDSAIVEKFAAKKLRYVRNYGNGLDVDWMQVFNTDDRTTVEAFCRQRNLNWQWLDEDVLRTWEVCQSEACHPHTGENVWFNQAHLFHVSNLDQATRDTLLSIVDEEDLPRNVYYGDGSAIEESVLQEIREVLAEEKRLFSWQKGDFLMLDNMLTAHGREPFEGERKVIVAMA